LVDRIVSASAHLLDVRESLLADGLSLADQYDSLSDPGTNDLRSAHEKLDEAVMSAYGFSEPLHILDSLLTLNTTLAQQEASGESIRGPGGHGLQGVRATDYFVPMPTL
jgi:hypothetical protein